MKNNFFILDTKTELKRLESKFDNGSAKLQLEQLGFKNGMKFLDVGMAGGAMTRLVASLATNSMIFGVDSNKNFVEYASSKAHKKGIKNVDYKVGNVYNLPFKNNTFDFVWCRFLLEYLKDPISAIKEMRRVAKTNGIVCCGDLDGNCLFHYPIEKSLESKLNKIMSLLKPLGFDPFVGRKLYHYFNQVGFKSVRIDLFPYHNVFGRPSQKDLMKWKMKIDGVIGFLSKKGNVDIRFLKSIQKEFMNLIQSEETFTYSSLIFARGIK